jgi:soluble lytic murein transglycosylase-like protein
MPTNDQYDDLFDAWGQALNVNPQLGKTVFHVESNGNPNVKNGTAGEIGPMQIKPATAQMMAVKLGFDPKSVDLHDMRWAVPLAMQYLADGLTATQSAEGALGYYNAGTADPKRWHQDYITKALTLYPNMALTPAAPQPATEAPASTQTNTPPPALASSGATQGGNQASP